VTQGLLSTEDVAMLLGVTLRQVRTLYQERRIAHVKVGKHVRFEQAEIDRYIAAQRVPAVAR
jgi:excisionase family DNA binding protein